MNIRLPISRSIAAIVADIEGQFARGQTVVLLPTELRRVIGAAVLGDPDAMRLAAVVPYAAKEKVG